MKSRIVCLAVAFAVAMVAGGVGFAAEEQAPPAKKYGMNVGDLMKPVVVKYAEGDKTVDTGALSRRTVFMLVSSVCTACQAELSEITVNAKEFNGKADLFAVIIDIDPKLAIERIKTTAPGVPLLADANYALGGTVNLISAPSALILDKEGKILYKTSGYSPGQWKEYLRTVLK